MTLGPRAQGTSRSPRRAALVVSVSALLAGASVLSGSVAHGAPGPTRAAAKTPASSLGELIGVAAVPHSSDVWAIGDNGGGLDNAKFFVAHRHNGRWTRVKLPSLGGRYGFLDTITAVSGKGVWIAGGRQQHGTIQVFPAIWRLSGQRFVVQKLPSGLGACACAVSSMSGSSSSNVWAVGPIFGANGQVALHWNGKSWAGVVFPVGLDFEGLTSVSTSGPRNAWGVRSDGNLLHWDGKTWVGDGIAPAGDQIFGIATSSAKLAYAVGQKASPSGTGRPVVLRFNGTSWSNAPVAKGIFTGLRSVTMHGRSAWAIGAGRAEVLHTTGGTWRLQKRLTGNRYGFRSISAESAKRADAVGYFVQGNEVRVLKTFFDVLNGHSWKPTSSKL